MNLSQLQYFKVLAQEEHYTRAAQMLSITQPSLSHAISQLEQELGTRLFEKKGRNVVLTRYGKMFLPYVEESLKVLNEGVQRIQEVNGSRHGIIHLAYIYTMGSEFAPKLVRKFLDAYPDYDIEFHFTVGTTGEIIDGLKDDKYDIVFSSYKDGEQDIDFKKIANQKLVLAVPMDHPLSIKDSVDLRDTIEYPQIYFEKGSGLRPVIDQMFEEKFSMLISSILFAVMVIMFGWIVYSIFSTVRPVEGWMSLMTLISFGFFMMSVVLTLIFKYLSVILNMSFKRQRYVIEGVEKLTK